MATLLTKNLPNISNRFDRKLCVVGNTLYEFLNKL